MPTDLKFEFTATGPLSQATQTVYTRNNWADAWVAQPNLHCEMISFAAAPGVGAASFHFRYGQRVKSGEGNWSTVSRFAPNPRGYVKVVISPTQTMSDSITWVGVWRRATDFGLTQRFEADSIEALLAYTPITDAFYYDVFGAVRQSQCAMTFNEDGRPNRSQNEHAVRTSNAHVFDADPERAHWWSTRSIVKYLLAAHPPLKADGTTIFPWSIFNIDRLPDYDRPTLPTRGKDVLSLLHSIISRFRLLSFRTEVIESDSTTAIVLRPFTFNESDIALTNFAGDPVGTIPLNDNQYTLDFRFDPSSQASLSIMASHIADRVVVTGGWRQSALTISKADDTLESTWHGLRETEYVDAEQTLEDAGELPAETERHDRDQAKRRLRTSDRYRDVFAQWRIKEYWDQKAGDGIGGEKNPIALDDSDDSTQYLIPQHLLRIESELPFLYGYEYADDVITTAATEKIEGHRAGSLFGGVWPYEQIPLLVCLKEPGAGDKWVNLATLGQGADLESEDITAPYTVKTKVRRNWSGEARPVRGSTVYIRDGEMAPTGKLSLSPAIRIDVHGEQQHVLALEEFVLSDDLISGSFNWKLMTVTIAVTDPREITVRYPEDVTPVGEFVNEKVIEVGDEYRQIYVCPGTVVGINEITGELIRSDGGYLQDDRGYLMVLAKRAYEWYKTPRYAFHWKTGFISGVLKVGDYVHSVRDTTNLLTVGSVITEITYEFPVAGGTQTPAPRAIYATQFGELDPTRVF